MERQGEIKRIKELEAKLIAQAKQFQQQMEERQKYVRDSVVSC